MSKRDADQLVKELKRHFAATGSSYRIEKRGGHWHVVTEAGKSIARFGSTPSEHRFRLNTVTDLRRRGILPPGWR